MTTRIKPDEIRVILGVAALLSGAGVLGWLGLGKLEEKKTEAQVLADRAGNPELAMLLADAGAMDQAEREMKELKKIDAELLTKYGERTKKWSEGTLAISGKGQEWSKDPGPWKDRLIKIQSDLPSEALAKGVQIPPEFYLGLEAFRQKSPMTEEVPTLAIHLSVARSLIGKLIRAREAKERFPTPCEIRSLTGPGSKMEKNNDFNITANEPRPEAGKTAGDRKTFRMDFRCSPEVLFAFLDLLQEDPQDPALYILTNVTLSNEKQNFPLRSEIAKRFGLDDGASPPSPSDKARWGNENKDREPKLLEILAGSEGLDIQIRVDFVPWLDPEKSLAESPAGKKP